MTKYNVGDIVRIGNGKSEWKITRGLSYGTHGLKCTTSNSVREEYLSNLTLIRTKGQNEQQKQEIKMTSKLYQIKGTKNDVSNSENKVSAFNSDTLITDTGAHNQLDENITQDITRDSQVSVIDWQTAFNNLSLSERTNIISVVLKDVATYLTVSVY